MSAQTGPQLDFDSTLASLSSISDGSMVEIKKEAAVDLAQSEEGERHRLLYSKSKVYVHPTAYAKDNMPGFLTLVKREAVNATILLAWIPESLLNEKGHDEWEKFTKMEEKPIPDEDEDVVLIDLPTRRPETYAFSVPLSQIYSLIVHPPTISSWHGSIAINLISGKTLPTLHFHDDESHSFATTPISPALNRDNVSYPPRVFDSNTSAKTLTTTWGGDDLIARLRSYAYILRSTLQPSLYLVDPSKADIETHTTQLFDDDAVDDILAQSSYANSFSPVPAHRRPKPLSSPNAEASSSSSNPYSQRSSVLHRSLQPTRPPLANSQAHSSLLQSFSNITRATRHAAQTILSHPLAKPIVPHLPDPVKSLVNAPGEWSSWVEKGGVGEFESARVYLARWARIVAEEGERARQREARAIPSTGDSSEEASSLGVFELLHTTSNLPKPKSTRDPKNPIDNNLWQSWFDPSGRPTVTKEFFKGEVFRRGIDPSGDLRKRLWPYLLGVYEWDCTEAERSKKWEEQKNHYAELKMTWCDDEEVFNRPDIVEERHRIDVDCRRTDRTQPLFITPTPATATSFAAQSPNGHQKRTSFSPPSIDAGAQAPTNDHIERLAGILLTYGIYEKELGYVQGMSDLCAPIYVVMGADEAMTFWCFVQVMNVMKDNFLRDQSGMKKKLLTLQQLISVMDPELYRHFEKADGLNLFFCFRWVLISFKREFPFEDVLRLWEVLWTNYYTNQFVLFIALAVLESHRDVILRYLIEFDEILKYCNELSMTIELDSTLAQAEVLFLSFTQLIADIDRRRAEDQNAKEVSGLRKRGDSSRTTSTAPQESSIVITALPLISDNLRELLVADP